MEHTRPTLRHYLTAHRRGIAIIAAAFVTIVGVVTYRHFFMNLLVNVSKAILTFAQAHPRTLSLLHIALNSVPDIAYMLLTLAGLTYLMPELMEKIEKRRTLRICVATVLVVIGLSTIILNAVNRERQERASNAAREKNESVMGSVQGMLTFLINRK